MEERRAFNRVKKKLRDAGIKHGLIFPARLIFTFGSEQKTFQDPAAVETYIDRFINVAAATADHLADASCARGACCSQAFC